MAAFNWILVASPCPACGIDAQLRCQTHVASDYTGYPGWRFHDREYQLGEVMAWWPREDKRFASWRADRWRGGERGSEIDEEACYASCPKCEAPLFVVLRFRENVAERVVAVGNEADWPAGYLK